MKDVAVVGYCRTGIAKATRGALNQTHGIPMTAHVLKHAVARAGVEPREIEDLIVGCGLPEGATDSLRFVASKTGSYMIFCAVPGHGLAGMWIRFKVSATETRPTLLAS